MSLYPVNNRHSARANIITVNSASPWRILLHNFIFCSVIALLLWLLVPSIGQYGLLANFVHSQAIGNSIALLAIAANVLSESAGYTTRRSRILIMIVVTPIGVFLGLWIARLLLGIPSSPVAYLQQKDQLLITAFIAILASALFNWHQSRRRRMSQLELQAAEQRHKAESARHAMLRAQLDPHMLFNTLANLRALIEIDQQRAIDMLDHLDHFLRATLKSSQSTSHTLSDEFSILQDYLELMKIRLGSRLTYTWSLPPEHAEIKVPALILQPVVENAIRHGIEPQIDPGEVQVSAYSENNHLVLQVIDTGVGIEHKATTVNSAQAPTSPGGFGLYNLRERLDQFYQGKAILMAAPLDQPDNSSGTVVTLKIPLTDAHHG